MLTPLDAEPSSDGDGLTIVVNPSAGSAFRAGAGDALREALPRARVVELDPDHGPDLGEALEDEVQTAHVIGVAGGDGSINTAAAIAHRTEKPLVVVPAGTLNHLARDLGLGDVNDAVAAVQHGHAVAVDVGWIDGKPFLNTASFGSYSDLVDARERLERHIGKWPALVIALVQRLRRAEPVHVEIDGTERRIWMFFAGNCCYHPAGFAPAWRERLDDGLLDIRLVGAERPYARLRLLAAVLTGRLGRSRVHEAFTTRRLEVRSLDGPLRLARDGETFEGHTEFTIEKLDRPLAVYVPRPD
jgi:undecaprenyl-diphosphatase